MIVEHASTTYVVQCDHCGTTNRSVVDGFASPDRAYQVATNAGWGYGLDEDFCPACNNIPHWLQQRDAINAAVAQVYATEDRPVVRRCHHCALWRIFW